jgi:hypothetical protein
MVGTLSGESFATSILRASLSVLGLGFILGLLLAGAYAAGFAYFATTQARAYEALLLRLRYANAGLAAMAGLYWLLQAADITMIAVLFALALLLMMAVESLGYGLGRFAQVTMRFVRNRQNSGS